MPTISFLLLFLAMVLLPGAAPATEDLYRARAIVTGQGEESRAVGLAETLKAVLVKVSGDPRLSDDPRVAAMAERAGEFVHAFRYRDRMAGIPVHDEQGTRDRPHDLTVDFDPANIDAALASLGRTPWREARPRLLVLVGVRIGATDYVLAADGDLGRDQRDALAAEAERFGLPVILPGAGALTQAGLRVETLATADSSRLDAIARNLGADLALAGSLTWSDEALGWISDWRLVANGESHHWARRGGSFDQAFRAGLGGAARILSGNGAPD